MLKTCWMAVAALLLAQSATAQIVYQGGGGAASVSYPLLASDGTAAAPSYSFTDDTDMGCWRNISDFWCQHSDTTSKPYTYFSMTASVGTFAVWDAGTAAHILTLNDTTDFSDMSSFDGTNLVGARTDSGNVQFAVRAGAGATPSNVFIVTSTAAQLEDAMVLRFEGATADDFETTLTVTDPTADRTITLPNSTGTMLLSPGAGFPADTDGAGTMAARTITAGVGITVAEGAGAAGNPTISADNATQVSYTSGTATPSAACSAGELYYETDADLLWGCTSTNTWTDVTTSSGAPTDAQYVTLATNATLSDERVFTPGDWLEQTDGGAGSTITVNIRPDPTQIIFFREEWIGGRRTNNAALMGEMGWTDSGGGVFQVGEAGHRGILEISTGAVINTYDSTWTGSTNGMLGPYNAATFRMIWTFKLVQTTDTAVLIGLSSAHGSRPPAGGIFLHFDSSANANFRCITRASSTSTDTDSTIAADTSWHVIDIRGDGGSNITFTLDGTLRCTNSTNIPTENLDFEFGIENLAAADKELHMDSLYYFEEMD